MKKLKRMLLAVLSMTIVMGCSLKSPSNVVKEHFEEIKKERSEQEVQYITEETKVNDMMDEAKLLYLNEINIKILSENIKENKATVGIKLTGLNMANMYMEIQKESLGSSFGKGEISKERLSKGFLEKAMLEEPETRYGKINLSKIDKTWTVDIDFDYKNLVYGSSDIPVISNNIVTNKIRFMP
ncbi:MAG: hypothetical protein ACRDA3_05520 [Peptostreptococcaceae bacterium]